MVNPFKKKNNKSALTDEQSELHNRLQEVQSYWTRQQNNIEDGLRFKSGDQWDETIRKKRERKGQPVVTTDFTSNIINRVVNPIRKYPYGMRVKHKDLKIDELYQGLIRDIEYRSNASEAYEVGIDNSCSVGIGYLIANTNYIDDESLDQTITIESVSDPTSIWIDPMTESVTGADMRYAIQVKYLNKDEAEAEYDLGTTVEYDGVYEQLYRNWIIPDNTIPEMLYWNLKHTTTKRTWRKDGTFFDGEPEEPINEEDIAGTREIEKKSVEVCRYVGAKEVSKTTLNIDFVPVICVYGDVIFDGKWRGYAGLVRKVRDTQTRINLFASNELQLIQTAPIAPWLITAGQITGFEKIWNTANTENHDHLPYKQESINGTMSPPPMRADNSAQTQHLQVSKAGAIDDMQRTTGIFDSNIGNEDIAGQSGVALSLKNSNADISSFHYIDNLTKSITQCGRVVLQLINTLYDTERTVTIRDEEGNTQEVTINIAELSANYSDFDTEVEAGPMLQNERETQNEALLEIGRLDPAKFSMLSDLLVENMNLAGGNKIVDRLRKLLPPDLQPQDKNAPEQNPQAMQALQLAEQQKAQLEQMLDQAGDIIQNLQTQIIDNESDRKADIEKAKIDAEVKLTTTQMNNESKEKIALLNAGSKAESDDKKIAQEGRQNIIDQTDKTFSEIEGNISDTMNQMPDAMDMTAKVGGPIGGELEGPEEVESLDDLMD